jgi:quinol monooxygenase YgiN
VSASSLRRSAPVPSGVCVIIRAEAKLGSDEEFLQLLDELAHDVRAAEPGCTDYIVTRMIGSHAHFAVHARFASWDAFNAHAETPHLVRVLPRLTALMAAPISMEIFLEFAPLGRAVRIDDARRKVEAQRHRE